MITSIQGTLASASPLAAVVEVNGLGYEVNLPVTTAEKLPAVGSTVRLHTHVVYREDAQTLYGFAAAEERDFFRLLIENVTGVGPKGALGIMSRLSLSVLQSAIAAGDVGLLAKCPGIGKKTAGRLVVELKGRFGAPAAGPVPLPAAPGVAAGAGRQHDAVLALLALGYKAAEADKAVRQAVLALGPAATTEQLIKQALG
ncbi:MAG: Holliday junction DNA helicase RuvA [Verrucomicrobia bacterium RIFCSPLOWO2_12_FULL_64_8]|nr:MAG: Holliday junction DNA helicase RuvA [Verrucomicrobia bacterium RIFCSPLOWO2_12_FULL_64_8]